jgi:hypothetical protein
MATYRSGKWTSWDGVTFYNIEKKTIFGWKEMNYWVVSKIHGLINIQSDEAARKQMMDAVDRLVKAGHTVI